MTGGGRGIGHAIVERLVDAGFSVAAADVEGGDVTMDVADSDSVQVGVQQVERELGPVDVLVNNAGWDELRPFLETDEEFWQRVIEINFKGCLRTTRALLPGMVERGYGRIVNIASDAGRVGSSGESIYSGAKGGVIAFSKAVAREVARKGVTVNCVCPGPTRTAMLESMGPKLAESLERAVPMRRIGEPSDVAQAVAFFASDEAGYITGQALSVSGGLTMI